MTDRIILASASPRRQELLAVLGLPFEVVAANIDEEQYIDPVDALETVRRTALEKAQVVATSRRGIIIAADTTVVLDGKQLAKPAGAAEAERMLRALRDREHVVATGLVVVQNTATPIIKSTVVASRVQMREYSDAEIESYIAGGDPFDKAGGYAIQHGGFRPVLRVDGCPVNVVGLPLCALRALLAEDGIETHSPAGYCQERFTGCCLANQTIPCNSEDRQPRS